jgi:hypothetical protein
MKHVLTAKAKMFQNATDKCDACNSLSPQRPPPMTLLSTSMRGSHHYIFPTTGPPSIWVLRYLTRAALEGLAEEDDLELIIDGQNTSTGDTTENVGTSTLKERLHALLGDDLAGSIQSTVVLDGLTGGHHHTTTDSVKRVRSDTGTGGDTPTKSERGQEVVCERTDEDNRLERVVHTEVQTTVDNNTKNGGSETTVQTSNTVRSKSLAVDVDETVELTSTTRLGVLGIVGKTSTGVVERVDEEQGSGTSSL